MAGGITSKLITYMSGLLPGTVTLPMLEKATGLDRRQIQGAMYRLAKDGTFPLEVISAGHVWRTLAPVDAPEGEPDDGSAVAFDVIEHLGGALVLRDADGALWLAKQIGRADA